MLNIRLSPPHRHTVAGASLLLGLATAGLLLYTARHTTRARHIRTPQPPSTSAEEIVALTRALPVSAWQYKSNPFGRPFGPGGWHIGPMAQDWHAAFGLSDNTTTIAVVDAFGILLVCVQALIRRVEALEQHQAQSASSPPAHLSPAVSAEQP